MPKLYDKDGRTTFFVHEIDARQALATGNYFTEDPTRKPLQDKKQSLHVKKTQETLGENKLPKAPAKPLKKTAVFDD